MEPPCCLMDSGRGILIIDSGRRIFILVLDLDSRRGIIIRVGQLCLLLGCAGFRVSG